MKDQDPLGRWTDSTGQKKSYVNGLFLSFFLLNYKIRDIYFAIEILLTVS